MNERIEKEKKDETEPFDDFICIYCQGGTVFNSEGMKGHVKDVHNIDTEKVEIVEKTIYHGDGNWSYGSCSIVYIDGRPVFLRKFLMVRQEPLFSSGQ